MYHDPLPSDKDPSSQENSIYSQPTIVKKSEKKKCVWFKLIFTPLMHITKVSI